MAPVKEALIVAGGLGTRMFPASAMLAKEALPLVDVPLLTHLIQEAVHAGATRIHIISRPGKDLNAWLEGRAELDHFRPDLHPHHLNPGHGVELYVHEQLQQRGMGDAIACALHAVDGPFLVLLGDNLLMTEHHGPEVLAPSTASRDLVEVYARTGRPVAGLMRVSREEATSFGMVAMDEDRITEVIEKPALGEAPSDLALCGRYLWTEDAASLLERYDVETHGELQSIRVQEHWMNDGGMMGVVHEGAVWYDAGRPLPWLKAHIDHALRREDLGSDLEAWLVSRLQ